MHRANLILTPVLGVLAVAAWGHLFYQARATWNVPSGFIFVPFGLTLLVSVGWIVTTLSVDRGGHETRCRKCRYILRGLTEPRCPECGTMI